MLALPEHRGFLAALLCALVGAAGAHAAPLRLEFRSGATNVALRGKDGAQQMLATVALADGSERDLTRALKWAVSQIGRAHV